MKPLDYITLIEEYAARLNAEGIDVENTLTDMRNARRTIEREKAFARGELPDIPVLEKITTPLRGFDENTMHEREAL